MTMITAGTPEIVEAEPNVVAERVLIVEDDAAARVGLEQLVRSWGFIAESACDGEEALEKVTSFRPAIVITDMVMPRMDGLALLRALPQVGADVTTLLLTAQGTVDTAVEAMKEGAYDYLTKPVDIQRLKILLDKIVERLETLREVKALRRQLREHGTFGSLIGNSPEMRKIYQVVEQAAPTAASVLITGESGTGKELIAQTIHQLSPRAGVSVHRHQLRGDSRDAARERDLRPRERRVHRRRGSAAGLLRARRPRHAVPRRDRRDDAGDAGQAAARAAGAQVPPPRRPHRAERRRPRHRRDQHRSGGGGADRASCARISTTGSTSSRFRLPTLRERKDDLPLLVQAFITEFNAAQPEVDRRRRSGGDADARALRVAGQRARAAQRHRARDDPRARTVHRDRSTCRRC